MDNSQNSPRATNYPGRTLAVDHGDSRIGLALSDPMGLFAQPLATLDNKGYKQAASDVLSIAAINDVRKIVVGLPLELDGSRGPQARKIDKFTKQLKRCAESSDRQVSIYQWDERMTTVAAERIIAGSKLKDSERSGALDRVAAALILEGFLASTQQKIGDLNHDQ